MSNPATRAHTAVGPLTDNEGRLLRRFVRWMLGQRFNTSGNVLYREGRPSYADLGIRYERAWEIEEIARTFVEVDEA
jgi:hypothetical protein